MPFIKPSSNVLHLNLHLLHNEQILYHNYLGVGRAELKTLFFVFFFAVTVNAATGQYQVLLRQDGIAIDFVNNIEWMRCSHGQNWNGKTCSGDRIKVSIEEAKKIASSYIIEGKKKWRLPTKEELLTIVKETNSPPMVDKEIFPNTYKGPYWTSNVNYFSSNRNWTVNFFTGQTFSRFLSAQKHAVRFVRDR